MPGERCRQVKATLLICMLALAEAHEVQQDVRLSGDFTRRASDRAAKSIVHGKDLDANAARSSHERANRIAAQMETLMADPDFQKQAAHISKQMETMMTDPDLQDKAVRALSQFKAMGLDAKIQDQLERVVAQTKSIIADPSIQKQAARVSDMMQAMLADLSTEMASLSALPETQAKLPVEQLQALMASPRWNEQAKRVTEQLRALEHDPTLQGRTQRIAEDIKAMRDDPDFHRHAKLLSEQLKGLKEHAKKIADELEATAAAQHFQEISDELFSRAQETTSFWRSRSTEPEMPTFGQRSEQFVDGIVDKLFDRTLGSQALRDQGLDSTTVGKASHVAVPAARSSVFTMPALPASRKTGRFTVPSARLFSPTSFTSWRSSLLTPSHVPSSDLEVRSRPARSVQAQGTSGTKGFPWLAVVAGLALLGAGGAGAAQGSGLLELPSIKGVLASDTSGGLLQAFLLIFLSEIGDKTFFIAGLLAAKYSKLISLGGSVGALGVMSIIAVVIGQIFHAAPAGLTQGIPFDDYVACAAFAYFGAKTLYDSYTSTGGESSGIEEERQDAEEAVAGIDKAGARSDLIAKLLSTFGLVFAAEIGDRSFISTVALSAALNPLAVLVGAVVAHAAATGIAVVGGEVMSKYLSEQVIGYLSGSLFIVFAITTAVGLF